MKYQKAGSLDSLTNFAFAVGLYSFKCLFSVLSILSGLFRTFESCSHIGYAAKIDDNFQLSNYNGIIFNLMSTILTRIQEIASKEGITIGAMERSLGASKGVLSRAISNGTDIQSKWIQILVEKYPLYSSEWLLTGHGTMMKDTSTAIAQQATNSHDGIPLIPISAMAGVLTGENSVLEYECERYIVPAFNGADFLISVKGNSMTPTYISGDIVACKRVPMTSLFFQWNKPYVLDTAQGTLIKRIKPGHDKHHILIVSDNVQYDPFELPYSEIYTVALVIGIIRLE